MFSTLRKLMGLSAAQDPRTTSRLTIAGDHGVYCVLGLENPPVIDTVGFPLESDVWDGARRTTRFALLLVERDREGRGRREEQKSCVPVGCNGRGGAWGSSSRLRLGSVCPVPLL